MNLTDRIDNFLEERASVEAVWDEQVSAFRDFVEMELQEQREACETAVLRRLVILQRTKGKFLTVGEHDLISKACLNAVEKSDE